MKQAERRAVVALAKDSLLLLLEIWDSIDPATLARILVEVQAGLAITAAKDENPNDRG